MRSLELFCGIGGFAAAATGTGLEIVAAIDISRQCTAVYRENFQHPARENALESICWGRLADFQAQLWWLSPPCQPYTSRGRMRDLQDPRSAALVHLLGAIDKVQPDFVLLENVARFRDSQSVDLLRQRLRKSGYDFREWLICPSFLGIANRRLRYYLAASRVAAFRNESLEEFRWNPARPCTGGSPSVPLRRSVADVLQEENWQCQDLKIPSAIEQRYREAINWVDPRDSRAVSSCFTSAYGRSPVYCGSYLKRCGETRYFAPLEILKLLGFDQTYQFPENLTNRQKWNLSGNSLSVDVVREILRSLPIPPV
jgi:DNA (cytosine-5)-methyltransferase 1